MGSILYVIALSTMGLDRDADALCRRIMSALYADGLCRRMRKGDGLYAEE